MLQCMRRQWGKKRVRIASDDGKTSQIIAASSMEVSYASETR